MDKLLALAAATILGIYGAQAHAHDASGQVTSAAPFGAPMEEPVWVHGLLDQFEGRFGSNDSAFRWQGEAWAGTDTHRIRLKTEGEASGGKVHDGQQEIFYSRPISTYFDVQVGGRYDLDSEAGRGWGAFGIEGLAPYFIHVSATAYISDRGHLATKLEGTYDLLLTQRLILQPQVEMNFYSKRDPARQIGAGLSDIDAALRLRYEISRKFAPYIGVAYQRKFNQTGRYAILAGEKAETVSFTAGLRVWF